MIEKKQQAVNEDIKSKKQSAQQVERDSNQ